MPLRGPWRIACDKPKRGSSRECRVRMMFDGFRSRADTERVAWWTHPDLGDHARALAEFETRPVARARTPHVLHHDHADRRPEIEYADDPAIREESHGARSSRKLRKGAVAPIAANDLPRRAIGFGPELVDSPMRRRRCADRLEPRTAARIRRAVRGGARIPPQRGGSCQILPPADAAPRRPARAVGAQTFSGRRRGSTWCSTKRPRLPPGRRVEVISDLIASVARSWRARTAAAGVLGFPRSSRSRKRQLLERPRRSHAERPLSDWSARRCLAGDRESAATARSACVRDRDDRPRRLRA